MAAYPENDGTWKVIASSGSGFLGWLAVAVFAITRGGLLAMVVAPISLWWAAGMLAALIAVSILRYEGWPRYSFARVMAFVRAAVSACVVSGLGSSPATLIILFVYCWAEQLVLPRLVKSSATSGYAPIWIWLLLVLSGEAVGYGLALILAWRPV